MTWTKNLQTLFVLALLVFLSCEKDEQPIITSDSQFQILNIGDSRVEGARPLYESYRYELWENLVKDGWDFDFVGYLRDEASYPSFMGQNFDPDHAGVGGAQTTDVLNNIDDILNSSPNTNVVLMDIGGNDLLEGKTVSSAIANINQIIDMIQAKNSDVEIFIEQIAPGQSAIMTPEVTTAFNAFNTAILEVATTQTTASSKVIAVDMASGWSDDLLADEVHYNEANAKLITDRYYQSMQANLDR